MGFGSMSFGSLAIIALIVVVLFGTKRLRTMGDDLGSALKGFRKGLKDETDKTDETNKTES